MEFKVGQEIHDISRREWVTIIYVGDSYVNYKTPYGIRMYVLKKEMEQIFKSSPLNKEVK